ncbi:MAG: Rid family hydrolase [Kiritimatiellia bacterium]
MTEIINGYLSDGVATLAHGDCREYYITLAADRDQNTMKAAADVVAGMGARVLHQFVFGGCRHYPRFKAALKKNGWPTNWLQGDACRKGEMLSTQLTAISGVSARPVSLNGATLGYCYDDEAGRHCRLGNIRPEDSKAPREEQAASVFRRMAAALESCGMAFTDTVRTWLYLDRLLEWYGPFNRVRTRFFEEQGVFDGVVPASTGIGAGNPSGAAVSAALIALRPSNGSATVTGVPSPLQCSARNYKSSFSRALEIAYPSHRLLYISGTASIAPTGESMHKGNASAQISLTMEVVGTILKSRGMDWHDALRGVAYYKDIRAHQPLFDAYCRALAIPRLPLAVSHADICRNDLLFEIELDAARAD